MNENEILEVEMELGGGDKVQMKVQESEDWSEIEAGTKALLVLVNGEQMLVEVNEADEDEGVSFKIIGNTRSYHYEGSVVASIFAEVKLQQPAVMRSFSLEEMKKAFKAGQETIWEDLEQTTRCAKFESFEEWFENYC